MREESTRPSIFLLYVYVYVCARLSGLKYVYNQAKCDMMKNDIKVNNALTTIEIRMKMMTTTTTTLTTHKMLKNK